MRRALIPLISVVFFAGAIISVVPVAYAQQASAGGNTGSVSAPVGGNTGDVKLYNPLGDNASLESLLNSILDFVIKIGAVVIVLMMVYVGFLFVTAQGDPGRIGEARAAFFWTIVGALVLLGAKAIALGVKATVEALR